MSKDNSKNKITTENDRKIRIDKDTSRGTSLEIGTKVGIDYIQEDGYEPLVFTLEADGEEVISLPLTNKVTKINYPRQASASFSPEVTSILLNMAVMKELKELRDTVRQLESELASLQDVPSGWDKETDMLIEALQEDKTEEWVRNLVESMLDEEEGGVGGVIE